MFDEQSHFNTIDNQWGLYANTLQANALAMLSKRYALSMFDDQAPSWAQVALKSSPNTANMAPAWTNMTQTYTHVAPKSF